METIAPASLAGLPKHRITDAQTPAWLCVRELDQLVPGFTELTHLGYRESASLQTNFGELAFADSRDMLSGALDTQKVVAGDSAREFLTQVQPGTTCELFLSIPEAATLSFLMHAGFLAARLSSGESGLMQELTVHERRQLEATLRSSLGKMDIIVRPDGWLTVWPHDTGDHETTVADLARRCLNLYFPVLKSRVLGPRYSVWVGLAA